MKNRLLTTGAALLLLAGVASAANGSAYYNLISMGSTYYLTQNAVSCNGTGTVSVNGTDYTANGAGSLTKPSNGGGFGGWWGGYPSVTVAGTCVASVKDTPENLYKLLDEQWISYVPVPSYGTALAGRGAIWLGTDIDLGGFNETTAADKCISVHKPLPVVSGKAFNGNGYTIRNLCYVAESMNEPVGFFSEIQTGQFNNVKIDGVKILINGSSSNGVDYYPVGALAGVVSMATVDTISVANVSIDAPFAGAAAGLIDNSSFLHITADDDVFVQNSTVIAGDAVYSAKALPVPYKVFLGGLAGVIVRTNTDKTLQEGSFKVEVKDLTGSNLSALGGVAGALSATTEMIDHLRVYTKVGSKGEMLPSRISGGSAMGGLFGYVTFRGDGVNQVFGDIVLDSCFFEGEIGSAKSPDEMFVGGLVGRDSVMGGVSFKILNSHANLTLADEVTSAGLHRYNAGGLLGASNTCTNGSGDEEDQVSITNSNSIGRISLTADAKKHSGVRLQAYVGGIAGAACLALDGNGFINDSSSMNIDVNILSSLDHQKVNNEQWAFDTISVGGLLGSANVAMPKALDIRHARFTGSISVTDSMNVSLLGGIIGSFREADGAKGISFKDVLINNKTSFMTYTAKAGAKGLTTNKQIASIGGLCGYCRNMDETDSAGIRGSITVTGNYSGDSLLVGGLFGNVYKAGTESKFSIHNTYTIGDIVVDAIADHKKVGYLVGSGVLYGGFDILANFHYSEVDDMGPFGSINSGDELVDWRTSNNIYYVLRNGAKKDYTEVHHNGTEVAATMHKSEFAGFLNTGVGDLVWAFENGDFDNLPFFADDTHPAAGNGYLVIFNGFDAESKTVKTLKMQLVSEGKNATAPVLADWEGHPFKNWDKDFSNVSSNLTVTALYGVETFRVTFWGHEEDDETVAKIVVENDASEYGSYEYPPSEEMIEKFVDKKGLKFLGWDTEDYKNVTRNMDIFPLYDTLSYGVIFKDVHGAKLDSIGVKYGSIIGELPASVEMAENDSMTYTFREWSPDPKTIPNMPAEDLEFVALFDSTAKVYTLTLKNVDGSIIPEGVIDVPYGSEIPALPGASMASNDSMDFVFKEWKTSGVTTMPAKNVVFEAVFDSVLKTFDVIVLDYDGSAMDTLKVEYGKKAEPKPYQDTENVRLDAWKNVDSLVTKPMTITAEVRFKTNFWITEDSVYVHWIPNGYNISYVELLSVDREPTAEYAYKFTGWDKKMGIVTGPETYVASYEKIPVEVPGSSSSVEPSSSSSSEEASYGVSVEVVKALEQSGNAARLAYSVDLKNATLKTSVYAVLVDEKGNSRKIMIADSLESSLTNETYVIAPAPKGKNSVKLFVSNGIEIDSTEVENFDVASEITVAPRSWNMVSLAEADGDLAKLASSTSIFWWDESNAIGDYWQYRSFEGEDFEASRGFWYGSSKGTPIILRESQASIDDELVWDLDSLYSGWNMVSNPYGWKISLENVKKNKDVLQVRRWNSEEGSYSDVDVLNPYEAVWIQVARPVEVSVDAAPVFVENNQKETVSQKMAALRKGAARKALPNNWNVLAVLKDQNGKSDSWNMIGAGSKVETLDKAPTGMGDFVRLAIMEGKNKLAKSVKAEASEYEWEMKLSATTSRDAELSFEGVEALNQLGLELSVTIDGKTQEVKAGNSVKVALTKNSTVAMVRVAPAQAMISSRISGFAVSQMAGDIQLGFDAPENQAGANVSYALVAVNGKKVASGNFKAVAGSNNLNLKAPQAGLYFVQLKIGSQTSSAKVMVK